jgi:hypothetical protein
MISILRGPAAAQVDRKLVSCIFRGIPRGRHDEGDSDIIAMVMEAEAVR